MPPKASPRTRRRTLRRGLVGLSTLGLLTLYGSACIRTEFGPLVFLCDPAGSAKCPDGTFCASDGLCRDTRCKNGVQDGYESDVDCGAFCGPCAFGQRCGGAADCQSKTCVPGATIPGKDTAARCLCPADQAAVTANDHTACVDLAEITNQKYVAFLDQTPAPSPVGTPSCAGNTSLQPTTGFGCPNPRDADKAQLPVVCVDFCDAEAYCKAQNKTLCGGFGGLSLASPGARIDPATSIWMAACTDVGRRKYPYTDNKDFTPNECVDQYLSPFISTAKDAKVTGCASLRDTCCAFRPPGALRAACTSKVLAGNAAACDAASASEYTSCTALGRSCAHLVDKSAKITCDAAFAAGDEKVCTANETLVGCDALSPCCTKLAAIPQRGEQAVECRKLVDAGEDKRCREGLGLYCPTFDTAGKEISQPLQAVQKAAACATRVGQPADLSGNAGEWEDNCDASEAPDRPCTIRGGSVVGATSCGMVTWRVARTSTQPDIGFRCCSQ